MSGDGDLSRPTSQSSAGRRRWELLTRESFETSLAVEEPSPVSVQKPRKSVRSARKSMISDPSTVYGNCNTSSARVRSATRPNNPKSRENSAKVKQNSSALLSKNVRGKSASSLKTVATEKMPSKPSKIPGLQPITVSDKHKKSLSKESGLMYNEFDNNDALARKISSVLKASLQDSKKHSSESSSSDSLSKEEGYESDADKDGEMVFVSNDPVPDNLVQKVGPSAPPYEYDASSEPASDHTSPTDIHSKNKEGVYSCRSLRKETSKLSKSKAISGHIMKLEQDTDDSAFMKTGLGSVGDIFHDTCLSVPGLIIANLHAKSANNFDKTAAINAIYCEQMNGFVLAKNSNAFSTTDSNLSERLQPTDRCVTRSDFAISLQTAFRTFAVFSQGLLAGISLMHCLLIFLVADSWSETSIGLPARLTVSCYALMLLLNFVCFVASCDRCDACSSRGGMFSTHSVRVPWSASFYLASLAITVATTRCEILLAHLPGRLPQPHHTGGVVWYSWLCLARAINNMLGWLTVVPDPHTDALLHRLSCNSAIENDPA